jgi:hypothetical protein
MFEFQNAFAILDPDSYFCLIWQFWFSKIKRTVCIELDVLVVDRFIQCLIKYG